MYNFGRGINIFIFSHTFFIFFCNAFIYLFHHTLIAHKCNLIVSLCSFVFLHCIAHFVASVSEYNVVSRVVQFVRRHITSFNIYFTQHPCFKKASAHSSNVSLYLLRTLRKKRVLKLHVFFVFFL